ncbi:MAG: 1-(5-phosphoribosyl)-5-[(5-phosphoribosylamino)methylideneamino]imidazole-4-carboxamide isomerase [Dehalococcoidia bacterium]|nr:1-(5-phosphoribosyl)-5-[(5-phosphoribosylamino)methylideneamino]imidazole-4-carboxamide isomerase [Dehalococcoidia bacterium]
MPAIDLRNGRCVRLIQGDFEKETVFGENPVEFAIRWQEAGAARLHVVDLDGAAKGMPVNLKVVEKIVSAVKIPVQLGGGIREMETIREVLSAGVQRVILGTVALENPELVQSACRTFNEAIVVGVDARDGNVSIKGWKETSDTNAEEFMKKLVSLGVRRFIYTDIARDGTLKGPNFDAFVRLKRAVAVPIIASGGISSIGHLKKLASLGVEGAIVGIALYTGAINLEKAIASMSRGKAG